MISSKERNIKVVFAGSFNKSEILTGPEKVCKRIFTEYTKIEQTAFIDYFRDGSKYGIFDKLFGFEKVTEVNQSPVLCLGVFRMLISLFRLNPEIIHILSFERFTVFIFILKLFTRCKIYYTANGIIRHENKYFNKENIYNVIKNIISESVIMQLSDIVFHLSGRSKDIILHYYRINKSKLKQARNGLDDYFLNRPNENAVKEINSIVFIGDLKRKAKGAGFLFDSLSKINTEIKLYVISESHNDHLPQTNEFTEIIIVNKISPKDLIGFYRSKNIVISTSVYDPFNISVLEAVSCGLYPVLTEETGLSEIIRDFSECSIVEYGDSLMLSGIISSLINNKVTLKLKPDLNSLSWENVFRNFYLVNY